MLISSSYKIGFTSLTEVFDSVYTEFISAGWNSVFKGTDKFTIETTTTVDSLSPLESWRVHMDAGYILKFKKLMYGFDEPKEEEIKEYGRIVLGTSHQLLDDGTVLPTPIPKDGRSTDKPSDIEIAEALIRQKYETSLDEFLTSKLATPKPPDEIYIPQYDLIDGKECIRFDTDGTSLPLPYGDISPLLSEVDAVGEGRVLSYRLSISDSGFVLVIKSEGHPQGRGVKWLCAQRLVDSTTGIPFIGKFNPVVCLTNHIERNYIRTLGDSSTVLYPRSGDNVVWQFIVREKDVLIPTAPSYSNICTDYSSDPWNNKKQISISERGNYLVTIPDGITTKRFLYQDQCMDLISFVSANVLSEGNTAVFNCFRQGDHLVRLEYTGERASINYNEGQRLLIQTNFDYLNIPEPIAIVSGNPDRITNSSNLDVSVSGLYLINYKWRIDFGEWSDELDIITPIKLKDLPEGQRVLEVIGQRDDNKWQIRPTTVFWTIDKSYPTAIINSDVPFATRKKDITISIGDNSVSAFKYKLDNNNWSQEILNFPTTKIKLTNLTESTHTIKVIGKNSIGNYQPENVATEFSWVVDTLTNVPILTNVPKSLTYLTTTDITISGRNVNIYKYRINNGTWSGEYSSSQPLQLSSLPDGLNKLEVLSFDIINQVWPAESEAVTYSWTINSVEPEAILTNLPKLLTNVTSTNINVTGQNLVLYKYKIDEEPWSIEYPLTRSIDLSNLSSTSHTLLVVVKNTADNWQETTHPTEFTWTIDTEKPVAVISTTIQDYTNSTIAIFNISGEKVVSYTYKLDTGAWTNPAPISSPISLLGLASETHTLQVCGIDALGNIQDTLNPTTFLWTIDTTAPVATISGLPTTEYALTHSVTDYDVVVGGTDVVKYRYSLDRNAWSGIKSVSEKILLRNLTQGGHSLRVVGSDSVGNWQTSASIYNWNVSTEPRIFIDNVPNGPVTSPYNINISVKLEMCYYYSYRYYLSNVEPVWSNWITQTKDQNIVISVNQPTTANIQYCGSTSSGEQLTVYGLVTITIT
jgi:hypothetical protein